MYRITNNYFTNSSCIKIGIRETINPYHFEILVENNIPNLELHYDDDELASKESAYFKKIVHNLANKDKYIIVDFPYGGLRGANIRLRCIPSEKKISEFKNETEIAEFFAKRFIETYNELSIEIEKYFNNPKEYYFSNK